MVDYSKRYLNLVQEPYQVIWWKLFNASCCSKWSNILGSGRTSNLYSSYQWACRACVLDIKAHHD